MSPVIRFRLSQKRLLLRWHVIRASQVSPSAKTKEHNFFPPRWNRCAPMLYLPQRALSSYDKSKKRHFFFESNFISIIEHTPFFLIVQRLYAAVKLTIAFLSFLDYKSRKSLIGFASPCLLASPCSNHPESKCMGQLLIGCLNDWVFHSLLV